MNVQPSLWALGGVHGRPTVIVSNTNIVQFDVPCSDNLVTSFQVIDTSEEN
jgi:hypothetical protein